MKVRPSLGVTITPPRIQGWGLETADVCMVAAHRDDLVAAAAVGLKTAFVPRPGEPEGPAFEADVEAWDFLELS